MSTRVSPMQFASIILINMLGFSKCEWKKKRENRKSEELFWRKNEKSFLPYRQKKGKLLSLQKETLSLLLKELRRRCPLAPSSLGLGFGQFLLNRINPVKIISYRFAGNCNIPKSCYSFQKVVTFQKVVIFLTDTIF